MTRWQIAVLAGTLAACFVIASASARQRSFSVMVDGVAVDVLVTRDRRPVAGLTAADFLLRDNGVRQQIESVMIEDVPITLFLALDVSDSVKGTILARLKGAAQAAVEALRPRDRIGLLTFSDRVRMIAAPPSDPQSMAPLIRSIAADGATALYDATFAAVAYRPRIPGRAVVLVFSDGDDTASWLDPLEVLKAAQRSDVVVHAVTRTRPFRAASGEDARRRQLQRQRFEAEPQLFGRLYLSQLVEDTGGSLFVAESADLPAAFARVVNEFRSRYVLTYSPEHVPPDGWHTIDVTLTRQKGDVRARRGYLR